MAAHAATLVVVPPRALRPGPLRNGDNEAQQLASLLNRQLEGARTEWSALVLSGSPVVDDLKGTPIEQVPPGTDALIRALDHRGTWSRWHPLSADDLIAACHQLSPECLFRTDAWRAIGGFRSAAGAWCVHEFLLRMIRAGLCVRVDEPTAAGEPASPPARLYEWDLDGAFEFWSRAVAAVNADASHAIAGLDHRLWEVRSDPRELRKRGVAARRELATLNDAITDATARLQERGARVVDWGDFDARRPLSELWGAERGRCVDRVYIEAFLEHHASDIRGRILEVHDANYTTRFGVDVLRSEVLDIDPSNPRATIVGDLRNLAGVADATFDCIILTQTLHLIFDLDAVLGELRRILVPGGVLLLTLPCAGRLAPEEGRNDFWRFTQASAGRLLRSAFPSADVRVAQRGNLPATMAYLYGLAACEAEAAVSMPDDPVYPLIITARVRIPGRTPAA